ncbi:hypothetical protein IFM89_037425 [Coptis chinensis]|uniref:Uncharacterized protein n=1 Tax=Coptis chinensis TaxID=261450 RepID=A0A835MED3_9MAGN|nr:hypothetical protein IFM89_037425 [Coptis chinensis]
MEPFPESTLARDDFWCTDPSGDLNGTFWLQGCTTTERVFNNAPFCNAKKLLLQGVKVSLVPAAVATISTFDYNLLHLIWTLEKLQQQLDVIDRRCEMYFFTL